MKPTTLHSPVTVVYDRDEFADALRACVLCLPLKSLKLSGPEGAFEAEGMLVSRDNRLVLEYSPIPPDGTTVPAPSKKGFSIEYTSEDFWNAEGVTRHGISFQVVGLSPPFHEWSCHNGHYRYEQIIQRIQIGRSRWEKLDKAIGDRSSNQLKDESEVKSSLWVWIPKAKLKITNAAIRFEEHHPFFPSPSSSSRSCFMGELADWRYCFTQKDQDILVYLSSKDGYSSPSPEHDRGVLNGILRAFSFIHGINAQPWRTTHYRSDGSFPDEFFVDFETATGAAQPVGGPQEHCLEGEKSKAVRMMNLMANYFASGTPLSDLMIKQHCQFVQACSGADVRLYECLHLCAVLEGIVKDVLLHRLGWSKGRIKDKKNTAEIKFKTVAEALKLDWDAQFEVVHSYWKKARNCLAHGDFFGPEGAWEKDVFKIHSFVSGGIMALMLADAGWSDPVDFRILHHTSSLYY